MTPEEVRRLVSEIRRGAADPRIDDEHLHAREDALYAKVLQATAAGCEDPQELAREAVKSRAISFFRNCA